MLIKLKDKVQILFWNLLFIISGIILIASMHGFISQLARFSMDEVNLLEDISKEKEEQCRGATKITRSGIAIVQSYSLGQDYQLKETEGRINILFIGMLLLISPILLIIIYTLLLHFSLLAVNRNICMWFISLLSAIAVFGFEFNEFIHNGNPTVFMLSTSTILIIMLFSLFISMQPKEYASPYYISKTELIIDDIPLAA